MYLYIYIYKYIYIYTSFSPVAHPGMGLWSPTGASPFGNSRELFMITITSITDIVITHSHAMNTIQETQTQRSESKQDATGDHVSRIYVLCSK